MHFLYFCLFFFLENQYTALVDLSDTPALNEEDVVNHSSLPIYTTTIDHLSAVGPILDINADYHDQIQHIILSNETTNYEVRHLPYNDDPLNLIENDIPRNISNLSNPSHVLGSLRNPTATFPSVIQSKHNNAHK